MPKKILKCSWSSFWAKYGRIYRRIPKLAFGKSVIILEPKRIPDWFSGEYFIEKFMNEL